MVEFAQIPPDGFFRFSQVLTFQIPFAMAWIGGALIIIFSFSFVRVIQLKIQDFKLRKTSSLDLEDFYSVTSWFFALAGLTLMFTGVLQVFSFSIVNSFLAALILALLTGIPMWGVVNQFLREIESGTIKEIDQYF